MAHSAAAAGKCCAETGVGSNKCAACGMRVEYAGGGATSGARAGCAAAAAQRIEVPRTGGEKGSAEKNQVTAGRQDTRTHGAHVAGTGVREVARACVPAKQAGAKELGGKISAQVKGKA